MVDISKLKIGEEVHATVYPKVGTACPESGIVVYVHPENRFFTVEFSLGPGAQIRESYVAHGPAACSEQEEPEDPAA